MHNFADQVKDFINNYKTSVNFTFSYEEKLLRSAGTIKKNSSFVEKENKFFILYADNLTNYNLTAFLDFHCSKESHFSMAQFRSDSPQNCSIALLDKNKTIISFEEKPKKPKSNLANAGIYLADPNIINLIHENDLTDIGYHLLALLVGKMSGWESNDYLIDIGTIKNLEKANKDWKIITES